MEVLTESVRIAMLAVVYSGEVHVKGDTVNVGAVEGDPAPSNPRRTRACENLDRVDS